jgi:hypothetical protein
MSACSAVRLRVIAVAVVSASALAACAGIAVADDKIIGASLGGRVVELLWVPEDLSWPAGGWRLERIGADGAAKLVKDKVGPGLDRQALGKLPAAERRGIDSFAGKLRDGTLTDNEREAADTIFVIAAILKPDHGRALGLRYRESNVPNGVVRYRLTALDADGNEIRNVESATVDTRQRTPLPPTPEEARADIAGEGVVVSWNAPPVSEVAPVAGYRLLRVDGNKATNLTPELLLKGKAVERVIYLDREASRDRALTYVLTSVDLFGRVSAPVRIPLPLGEIARAIAPEGLSGEAGVESAALSWSAVRHPGVRGYALERSLFAGGPYEVVTPSGLELGVLAYSDEGLRAASTYYYRVRVFDAEGNLGRPSLPVRVVPLSSGRPGAPADLKAEAGRTRVELTWAEPEKPVAGYFVYRRLKDEREWKRLNGVVTPETLYYDRFEPGAFSSAELLYRVQAIGYDDAEGAFSREVRVAVADTALPSVPRIVDASGEGGVATLHFALGDASAKGARFIVLRSAAEDSLPEPVGEPVAAEESEYVDSAVEAGASYWYRVVALDAAGNRSDESDSVIVTVFPGDLPKPPKPAVAYRARPFPYVALTLRNLPEKLTAMVEARADGGKWLIVAGPLGASGTVNLTQLPESASAIEYRVYYLAANGARGGASEPVTVRVQQ